MKIAVLGSAPTSRLLAPFDQKDWTIWGCSMANADLHKIDVWFDPHCYEGALRKGEDDWLAYLNRQPLVYMQKQDPAVKNSKPIPFLELRKEFGDFFWSSTVAYMLAMAIMEKPTHIGLYGIDMCHDTEYGHQRLGCQFFMHEAWKRGIRVIVPPEAEIGQPFPPYGYRDGSRAWRRLDVKRKELKGKLAEIKQQRDALERGEKEINGALAQLVNDEIYVCAADEFSQPVFVSATAEAERQEPKTKSRSNGNGAANPSPA